MAEKLHKVSDAKYAFVIEHQREPTLEELSLKIGVPRGSILNALGASRFEKSLEDKVSDYEGHFLGIDRQAYMKDLYLNDPDTRLSARLEVEYICQTIASAMRRFKSKRNIQIISYRCGLDDDFDIRPLETVGNKFDLTRERIRQIMLRFYRLIRVIDKATNNNLGQDKSLEAVVVRLAFLAELAEFDYDDLRKRIFVK